MSPVVATALASAAKPVPELAADVVKQALARVGASHANSVLLFLTGDFARHSAAAVHAASRAANCLQVTGCTASGIFTESDWVLDRPAACALVFTGGLSLAPADGSGPLMSLAVPQAATEQWIADGSVRLGMISTDGAAQEPGRIWCHGKLAEEGRCEAGIRGAHAGIGISRGIRILSTPQAVSAVSGHDLQRIEEHPALQTLLRELPLEVRELDRLPLHLLFAGVLADDGPQALERGRFDLVPIITVNGDDRSLTLAARLEPGARLFWAMRQTLAAERDTRVALDQAAAAVGGAPDFAVVFSCMGRGPYFYGGVERDLALLAQRFPGMPYVGAYGAGEIAPIAGVSRIIHNSAVFALFRADVQPDA
jgi:small ligand-binding sensory domain FIST